jgi:CO/xanthine dehydrogenase Mo-binding subunit
MRDARERVVGTIPLVLDLRVEGMVQAKVVRSVVPHATIVSIDTSDALAREDAAMQWTLVANALLNLDEALTR